MPCTLPVAAGGAVPRAFAWGKAERRLDERQGEGQRGTRPREIA